MRDSWSAQYSRHDSVESELPQTVLDSNMLGGVPSYLNVCVSLQSIVLSETQFKQTDQLVSSY